MKFSKSKLIGVGLLFLSAGLIIFSTFPESSKSENISSEELFDAFNTGAKNSMSYLKEQTLLLVQLFPKDRKLKVS